MVRVQTGGADRDRRPSGRCRVRDTVPCRARARGWCATRAADGGVDLRTSARGRSPLAAAAAILAVLAAWQAGAQWNAAPASVAAPWLGLAAFLGLFALWCAVGDEVWHLDANLLVHRIGAGGWSYVRAYRDARLELEARTSNHFNVAYFQLNAVTRDGRHRLIERRHAEELGRLARVIAHHTGWRVL
jgi:hypothetical protein